MFVFPPHQFYMLKFNANVMIYGNRDFGRCLDHEGGVFMNRISALKKEASESSFSPSSVWGHSNQMAIYEPRSGPPPATESASALMLNFSASNPVKNKFQLFNLLSPWYCGTAARTDEDKYRPYFRPVI